MCWKVEGEKDRCVEGKERKGRVCRKVGGERDRCVDR